MQVSASSSVIRQGERGAVTQIDDRVVAVGVPLGIDHDPRPGAESPMSTVRLGDRFYRLDDEAIWVWTQGMRAPAAAALKEDSLGRGIQGAPVEELLASGLLRRLADGTDGLALVPLGVAIGNSVGAPGIYEIEVGRGRPVGVDPLVFAAWSASYRGRSLHDACTGAEQATGAPAGLIARHVLAAAPELLGVVFHLDASPGDTA